MEQRNNYCTCAVGSEDSNKLTFRSASPVARQALLFNCACSVNGKLIGGHLHGQTH